MDPTTFETRLSGLASLTDLQRRSAWQALALSEAAASPEAEALEQVFQALIDCSRALLDLKTIKTILGDKGRPKYRPRNMRAAEWEVAVERPTYDLTVFKLHCGKLALKIYSKGERVLRIEAVAHNVGELHCGRLLDNFPEIVRRLRGMLERFMEALSCIDQCFIGDEMLERLPLP